MNNLVGKKVLFLITKSNWGGAQSYVFTLAKKLHDQGEEVAVCCGGADGKSSALGLLAERLQEVGIRVIPLPIVRDISLRDEVTASIELYKILRRERPDILHINSSKAGVIGTFSGRVAGVSRIIFTAHGWPHREKRALPMRIILWLGSWFTVLLSSRVIVVSQIDYKTSPTVFFRANIKTIHNGVSAFPLLPRMEARAKLSREHSDLSVNSYWILIVAELTKNKAIDIALRSFAKIAYEGRNVQMVIMGSGEERDQLQKRIQVLGLEQNVFLMGFTPDAKSYLLAGDSLLLPSRKEGLPTILLEAGIASLPVVATNVGGIPEIIQSSYNGLLVGPDDVGALAEALAEIVRDKKTSTELGKKLHETVLSAFSETEMISKTFDLYT